MSFSKISIFTLMFSIFYMQSCQTRSENLEKENNSFSRSSYKQYSDDVQYSLGEFLNLDHDLYGNEFITRHINNVIDNRGFLSKLQIPRDKPKRKRKVKGRFRWNNCDPLGACLIIGVQEPHEIDDFITECDAYFDADSMKLILEPNGKNNGMLTGGEIFVEQISLSDSICESLGIPINSYVVEGIYISELPSDVYEFGRHAFNVAN